jgi:p-hydroxybenzoic acid efflux pump subunit AaeB
VVAIFIAFALHLDKPYWAGMTVVIVANLYVGSIIDKAILRIIGTVVGVCVGFLLARMIVNNLFFYLFVTFLLISVAVYYYNFSSYAYAYLLGALGAFIVIAQLAMDPDETFYVAIWRPIEIGLGVIVSAAAAFCLFPNKIQDSVHQDVSSLFVSLNTILEQLKRYLLTEKPTLADIEKMNVQLKRQLKKTSEMIGFMRREFNISREKIDEFRVLLDLFLDLGRDISYFTSSYKADTFPLPFENELNGVFEAIHHDLIYLEKAFFTDRFTEESLQTKAALILLDAELAKEARDVTGRGPYFDILYLLQQVHSMLTHLANVLIKQQRPLQNKNKLISGQQQLSRDLEVIKHSIKAGLAAVLALVFWLISNWPGGLNGIISSVLISVRKDLFEMKNFSLYRTLGCLIGGFVALFPLAFFSLNLYALLFILFFPIWAFSYFSFKYPRYNYIGLQANIALIICLAQAGGPPIDLSPPLERFAGILIGIFASFLVGNILWRTHPLTLFSKNIKKLFSYQLANMRVLFNGKGNLYDLTNLFWLIRNLMDSLSEEQLNARKRLLLNEGKKKFTQLTLIQATLGHIYRSIDLKAAYRFASTIEAEQQLKEVEQDLLILYQSSDSAQKQRLAKRISNTFATLDLNRNEVNTEEAINFERYLKALRQLLVPWEHMD